LTKSPLFPYLLYTDTMAYLKDRDVQADIPVSVKSGGAYEKGEI
jgi:hypothetical protein